ncbi:MAG TPA: hypothetical protein PL070_09725 [Flavobacteriales bacterium]|nr:hypothetical protein [Flavobacteriales bacterium]
MIRRDRTRETVPKDLVGEKSLGAKELAKVTAWLNATEPAELKLEFKAYKAPSVSAGLERLFQGKCAYCESYYTRTQPVDIEHWRPKARVEDSAGNKVPGYPWLAMAWENLLPSCIDCNRARKQLALRYENNVLRMVEILQGKADQFPLLDEKKRVTRPGSPLDAEQPLILDPCTDDPAQFFRFDTEGAILPKDQRPRSAAGKLRRDRALKSIEVYALNRKGLVDERKERILILRSRFDLIAALTKLEKATKDKVAAAMALALIDTELAQLTALCDPGQPYSQMNRQFVHEFLTALKEPI